MAPVIVISDAAPLGDDGVAIGLLIGARDRAIVGIVATSGNVWAEDAERNLRAITAQLGDETIPISLGLPSQAHEARAARARIEMRATRLPYVGAFAGDMPVSEEHHTVEQSCRALLERIAAAHRPDLVALGPASVLHALTQRADLKDRVGRVFMMGGALDGQGNVSGAAEFNFWFDPEAAESLLASSLPVTLLPLDATRGLTYAPQLRTSLDLSDPPGAYLHARLTARDNPFLCDEVLAAAVLEPSVVKRRVRLKLGVETAPGAAYGALVRLGDDAKRRAVDVILKIDDIALARIFSAVFRCKHPTDWFRQKLPQA
jgi:pyrimidine-specific ribonucleoside hydrolase